MLLKKIANIIGITIGSLITAVGVSALLVPNKIAAGGASGIATLLYHLFQWSPGIILFCINVPLLILSGLLVSWRFAFNSILGSIATSFFVFYLEGMQAITTDPLLATLYGGIFAGVGIGIVFRSGGSTGGTDLLARILVKYTPMTIGMALLTIDIVVVGSAALVFNIEYAMYALIGLYLTAKVIDVVQEGISYTKQITIISDQIEEITSAIFEKLGRGVTHIYTKGGYTGAEKLSAMVIIRRNELSALKNLIKQIDSKAFVIVTDVHQVLGEGFKELSVEND